MVGQPSSKQPLLTPFSQPPNYHKSLLPAAITAYWGRVVADIVPDGD